LIWAVGGATAIQKGLLEFDAGLAQGLTSMQPGQKRLLSFLGTWAINTLAVAVAVAILRGHITYQHWSDLLIASLLLGLLNAFVRPILMLLMLPLLIFTLGLFTLVINAVLLYFIGYLLHPYFQVDSFLYAFLGAVIIAVVSIALNLLTGNARMTIQKGPPPSKKSDDDVIDV
jgi:putative membrane protein